MSPRTRRASLACAVAGVAVAALPAAAGAAVPTAGIVAALNAERARHGLPADVVEDPGWSAGCALHNAWQARNGGALVHGETPGTPGYTEAGHEAGAGSILSRGASWRQGNPWRYAPLHYMQMMAPALSVTGAAESGDADAYNCMWTWAGMRREFRAVSGYAIPGDGATGIDPSETASESPFVPGDFVGLPEGTTTGPHIYWFTAGPREPSDGPYDPDDPTFGWNDTGVRLVEARLTGPAGPLELRSVDTTTPRVGAYLPAGAISIPVRPLTPGAAHVARAVLENRNGARMEVRTAFVTARRPNAVAVRLGTAPRTVRVTVEGAGAPVRLSLRAARGWTAARTVTGGTTAVTGVPAGAVEVCWASGGEATQWEAATGCARGGVPGVAPVRLVARGAAVRVRVPPVRHGQRATVAFRPARGARTRSVVLRDRLAVAVPRGARRVCLSAGARRVLGVDYLPSTACVAVRPR
jgi:hypothetical protein